jgi:hypothetical protein
MTSTYKPRHFRIFRRVSATTIVSVEDALTLGKIKWTLTTYKKGEGSSATVEHYMDTDTAALLAYDLLALPCSSDQRRGELATWWDGYTEYRGTVRGENITSRTLRLDIATETKNPFRVTISNGPGELLNAEGAIKPKAGAEKETTKVSALLPWQVARTLAIALHHHIAAYQTMTYYSRTQTETWQPPDDGQPPAADTETGEILHD